MNTSARRVLVVGMLLVLSAIAGAALAADPLTRRFFDNVHWTTSYITAALLAWTGVRQAQGETSEVRRCFAIGLSAYTVGQLLWDAQVAIGWNPFPGPSDLFFVALGPMFGLGLLRVLWRGTSPSQRWTALLDVFGLTAAVLALTLALYLPRRGAMQWVEMTVLVAYPVVLCWAACVGLITALTLRLAPRRSVLLLLGALLAHAAIWLRWNSLTLDGALQDGTWFNATFSLAAPVLGVGSLRFEATPTTDARWERWCEGALRMLPLISVVLSAAAVVLAYTLPEVPDAMRSCALVGGMVVVLIASVRQAVILRDRDQLIAVERALREHEEAYRMLVEHAADGIFIADQHGRYTDVNPAGAAMLGRSPKDVVGLMIQDIVAPQEVSRIAGELTEVLAGKTVSRLWVMRRKDGSELQAEVTAKMLPDGRLQGVVRDVSAQRELEAQLRQAQKLEAVGRLAAGIAHDFNNVLAAIRGHTELLGMDLAGQQGPLQSVREIETASARATSLVQQIVAFARPRKPTATPVRLQSLVTEIVGLLRPTLPSGVAIETHFAEQTPSVAADPAQLHQVLVNLCTNAAHATHGVTGRIQIRTEGVSLGEDVAQELPAGRYARLVVEDDGTGMDEATRERIFDPFFTTRPVGEGTGLGLAMVRSIVRSHGGSIRVQSQLGKGTVFTIDLPATQLESTSIHEPSPPRHTGAQLGPLRVVYVDDEASLVRLVTSHLEREGHSVSGYTDPRQALAHLQRQPRACDVVISDYNMPGMSGIDVLRQMRALRPDLVIVMTSGFIDDSLRAAAQELRVTRILQKPVAFDALRQALADAALAASIEHDRASSPITSRARV